MCLINCNVKFHSRFKLTHPFYCIHNYSERERMMHFTLFAAHILRHSNVADRYAADLYMLIYVAINDRSRLRTYCVKIGDNIFFKLVQRKLTQFPSVVMLHSNSITSSGEQFQSATSTASL